MVAAWIRTGAAIAAMVAALAGCGAIGAQPAAPVSEQIAIPTQAAGRVETIPAELIRPPPAAGDGPFPAVVIAHDCSSLGPRSSGAPKRWADVLTRQGYVVLIPDSFATRGFPGGVCTVPPDRRTAAVSISQSTVDAYAALAYLRTLPFVDGRHVGMMGGSHGGTTTLLAMAIPAAPDAPLAAAKRNGFAAAIALYPGCAGRYGSWNARREHRIAGEPVTYDGVYEPIAPPLILAGEKDDWTPAEHCRRLAASAEAKGYPVTIKVYPGAHHSFDSRAPVRYVASRSNPNVPGGLGATTGGDPSAWADSIDQVTRFFADHLKHPS
jgi:dienelactone hydrolase